MDRSKRRRTTGSGTPPPPPTTRSLILERETSRLMGQRKKMSGLISAPLQLPDEVKVCSAGERGFKPEISVLSHEVIYLIHWQAPSAERSALRSKRRYPQSDEVSVNTIAPVGITRQKVPGECGLACAVRTT